MSDEPACAGKACAIMKSWLGPVLMRCDARAGRVRGHGELPTL